MPGATRSDIGGQTTPATHHAPAARLEPTRGVRRQPDDEYRTRLNGRLRTAFVASVALACGATFWYIGYRILASVHPAEDAYILFKYAENLAAGHGIVFNVGGPRAEGATDFLWLLLVAGGVRLGGDVALVALGLNAAGAALAGGLVARQCWGPRERPYWARALLCAVLPAAFVAGGAPAGYWGFSAMLYSSLILLLFAVALQAVGRAIRWLPVLGLVTALFRPDGAIVGVGFAALGLWRARSERQVRSYLAVSAACAAAGLGYFAWRWIYFGLPLPLPLYVKQNVPAPEAAGLLGVMPGLTTHYEWLVHGTGPLYILIALVVLLVVTRAWRDPTAVRTVVFLLPLAALFLALAFAVQTQNISWRFQAPGYLVLLYALLHVSAPIIDAGLHRGRRSGPPVKRTHLLRIAVTALAAAVVLPSIVACMGEIRMHHNGRWRTYLEAFAPQFGPMMDRSTVVALTEAGALPYWTGAQIADIVGLNLPETALRPPSVESLAALNPDMVFLHQGTSLMNDVLVDPDAGHDGIYPVTAERLGRALRPARRAAVERRASSYDDIRLLNVQYAPSVMIKYLSERADYDILAIDIAGSGTYLHVLGLKKDWPLRGHALEILRWSMQPENYRSYLEIRRAARERVRAHGPARS